MKRDWKNVRQHMHLPDMSDIRLPTLGSAARDVKIHRGALGAGAVGALAVGALAIGALAIGAMAINRLAVKRARFDRLSVGTLEVDRLVVHSRAEPDEDDEA